MKKLALLLVIFLATGCASLLKELEADSRRNEEQPVDTAGGMWPERRVLELADQGGGRAQRGIASVRGKAKSLSNNLDDEVMKFEQSVTDGANRFKNGNRATRADFQDDTPGEGSLWASTGQTNYFFTKNKIKNVGDIITVRIDDQLVRDIATEVKKSLSEDELGAEIESTETQKKQAFLSGRKPAAKPSGSPSPELGITEEAPSSVEDIKVTANDVDLSKSIGVKSGDSMMAEVLERYPNGNYRIRASKRVPYRNSMRYIAFVGVARSGDLDDNETIPSEKFYEYRVKALR